MKPRKISPRDLGFYILILLILVSVVYLLATSGDIPSTEIENYSEVRRLFENGDVEYFSIEDGVLTMRLTEAYGDTGTDTVYHELMDLSIFYADMSDTIDELMVTQEEFEYNYKVGMQIPWWVSMIPYVLIFVIIFVLWGVMASKAGVGGDRGAAKFGKARTRLGSEEKKKVTFADVAGADEEKEELQEIVDFLKNPQKYTALGARIPKGVLLVGPPGTGKTLIAKAVAGEANTQFLSISGSDFVELYVGVGASRVRDLFDQAKKLAPAIIFIDEIDAVGRQRGAGLGGGHDEREQTLNQLLVEMDGFGSNEGVIVMAATNRADILDNALLRPGRFDRQIYVGVPDIKGREEILRVHAKGKMLGEDVDLRSIARGTPGFTGADLENLLNEAALLAVRKGNKAITEENIEEATIKVVMGAEKKSHVMSDKDKLITSYHEAGHAIVSYFLPTQDPVHQISIIPRGMAAGYTMYLPTEDKGHTSKNELLEDIVSLLGGRAAEELTQEDICTGASNDIERATDLARKIVTKFGMSDKLGLVAYGNDNNEVFLGRDFSSTPNYSEKTAAIIDEEIESVVMTQYEKALNLLKEAMPKLHETAKILFEREKISGEDFRAIMES